MADRTTILNEIDRLLFAIGFAGNGDRVEGVAVVEDDGLLCIDVDGVFCGRKANLAFRSREAERLQEMKARVFFYSSDPDTPELDVPAEEMTTAENRLREALAGLGTHQGGKSCRV